MKKKILALRKTILTIGILFPFVADSQAVINVNVLSMSFFPANTTIDEGDTIRWTNTSGNHNVNGTLATYPSNPETFGNSLGASWIYSHKFLTPGDYDYRCDQHFGSGMVGTITVLPAGGIKETTDEEHFVKISPNPTSDYLSITLLKNIYISDFTIYDLSGAEVLKGTFSQKIAVDQLKKGVYFLSLNGDKTLRTKFIVD